MSEEQNSPTERNTERAGSPGRSPRPPSPPVKLTKSVEAVLAKPKDTFLQDLYSFMESIQQPITKMPSLGYQELDLHRLFHAVITRGGMDEVTRRQEWKLVYQDLEIPTMSTSASYNTRTNYKKYLYLYELETCDWGDERPEGAPGPKFKVGDYVRIESSTYEGQVFYAQIAKYRYRNNINMYYVHYNGWSTSHDEWMPESVLDSLRPMECARPESLVNPSPTRSSKSNYLIYDPLLSEKHHNQTGKGATGSVQTTPNGKLQKKKGSPGRLGGGAYQQFAQSRYDEEFETDEEQFVVKSMAATVNMSAPLLDASLFRQQPRRRPPPPQSNPSAQPTTKSTSGKLPLFLGETDHPVHDDKIHGYPKRKNSAGDVLDFRMGQPEQLYYQGGRWKHSTPLVRKFHLHQQCINQRSSIQVPIDEESLQRIVGDDCQKVPEHTLPKLKIPKLPQTKIALLSKLIIDPRPMQEIKDSIAEKEARLKTLKRDLKHRYKLMIKYYGSPSRNSSKSKRFLK